MLGNSPFLRRVDLSRSLVLRGIADIEGVKVAVLVDRDTNKTHFVGGDKNEDGWSLLEIEGNLEEMGTVSAKLSVTGGEVISVAYAEAQINPLAAPVGKTVPRDQIKSVAHEARNFRQGMSADGYPNPPPKHVVDRFSKLNESQRMRIIYEMRGHYRNGKGTRERQQIFDGMVNRALRQRR